MRRDWPQPLDIVKNVNALFPTSLMMRHASIISLPQGILSCSSTNRIAFWSIQMAIVLSYNNVWYLSSRRHGSSRVTIIPHRQQRDPYSPTRFAVCLSPLGRPRDGAPTIFIGRRRGRISLRLLVSLFLTEQLLPKRASFCPEE